MRAWKCSSGAHQALLFSTSAAARPPHRLAVCGSVGRTWDGEKTPAPVGISSAALPGQTSEVKH